MPKKIKIKDLEFKEVKSSNIHAIAFVPKQKTLFIMFIGDNLYSYENITQEMYEELMKAESQGKWVWKNLRDKPEHPVTKH